MISNFSIYRHRYNVAYLLQCVSFCLLIFFVQSLALAHSHQGKFEPSADCELCLKTNFSDDALLAEELEDLKFYANVIYLIDSFSRPFLEAPINLLGLLLFTSNYGLVLVGIDSAFAVIVSISEN